MKRTIDAIKKKIGNDELMTVCQKLNQSYYAYMSDAAVWELILAAFPGAMNCYLERLRRKYTGHHVVNDLLMYCYPGERFLKYQLAKRFLRGRDEVTLFEMRVVKSRLDVGRINGKSFAYEIKTEFDNLGKLEKQIADYAKVFEYVVLVTHERHVKKALAILPDFCGVEVYTGNTINFSSESVRSPQFSPLLEANTQLCTLTSKDCDFILRQIGHLSVPAKRSDRESILKENLDSQHTNFFFKEAIKQRYSERWNFIQSTFDSINPIDIQELFVGPIDPQIIYSSSSIEYM